VKFVAPALLSGQSVFLVASTVADQPDRNDGNNQASSAVSTPVS
jgi:hypothetical protein